VKRNLQFVLRLSEDELQSLNIKVKKVGMSREGYVRQLINGYAPVCVPPIEYFSLIRELRAIGNNMCQIAYRANSMQLLDAPYYKKNADRILKVCDYLYGLNLPIKVGDMYGYNKNVGSSQSP
jgi:hypothetical protein